MFLVFFDFFSNIICMRENKVVILLDVEYVRMLSKKAFPAISRYANGVMCHDMLVG